MTDADDLDSFIKQQKEKIARDREQVSSNEKGQAPGSIAETGLALEGYGYEQKRKNLLNEKQREYNDILSHQSQSKHVNTLEPAEETGLPLAGYEYEQKRKNLQLEKQQEYNSQISKVQPAQRNGDLKENVPPPGRSEPGIVAKLGTYEEKKRKLQEERKREYNMILAQKEGRRTGGRPAQTEVTPITAIPQQSQRDRPSAQKHDGGHNDDAQRVPEVDWRGNEEYYATLPGLRDHPSAEARKIMERNREYNELLQVRKQPRANAPPERYPDVGDEDRGRPMPRKGWSSPTYDELLEKKRKEEKNYRRYNDPGYDGMKSSRSENTLNKPGFDPEERGFRYLDREYEQKRVRFAQEQSPRNLLDNPQWLDMATNPRQSTLFDPNYLKEYHDLQPRSHSQAERRPPPSRYDAPPSRYDAPPTRYDAPPTRYDDPGYRSARPPEGQAATLAIGSEQRASADQRRKEMYRRELQQQMELDKQYRARERTEDLRVNATGAYDVGQRPDRQQLPDRQEPTRYPSDPYRPLSQPSMPAPSMYRSPLDDAYSYYANRNPLDTQLGLGGVGLDAGPVSDRPRVAFDTRPDPRRDPGPATTAFPVEDKSKPSKDSQRAYQDELRKQMEEQKMKKQREKEEKERYERKLDAEIANYDPFGRGGGGAPMKDAQGNIIADLREMHHDNQDPKKKLTPRQPPPSVNLDPYKTSPDKDTFERGGHGIFGEPMTDTEKVKRKSYQDELRQQMEDKKRKQDEEKERQRLEDEKLLQKIEEDNQKMQRELQAEKDKERAKHEAEQRAQEELQKQRQEKRKEDERKQREADDRRQDELRRQEAERRRQREDEDRQRQRASPPVPARKTQSRQSRAASADVLNQLARMRQQLQSERKRVESDLKKEQEAPNVYDPRLHKPTPKTNIDVFEVARNKEPVAVRRHPSEIHPGNVQDFQQLKHRAGSGRSDFRKLFPNTPQTNDGLETQQRVLLDHQAESIDGLRKRRNLNKMNPKDLGLLREGSVISAALLESDSAFIDIPNGDGQGPSGINRNTSARNRHRLRSETPKSDQFGSVASLDPDKITQKNDERLRRLKSITGDDVSLASADPDDILDRFMAKQQHTRPASGQTLMDDSWLRPGTRVT